MADRTAPELNKLPFLMGDALLVGVGAWLALRAGPPLDIWRDALLAACVAAGAWLAALPFLIEYRAQQRLAEADGLTSAVAQIEGLRAVGEQVAAATGRWQTVQEAADRTAQSAKGMADQISEEARRFQETMQKFHDAEIRNLRLEVEKLHRAEGESLQVIVRIMDHVYALYCAGAQSGQPGIAGQLGRFQDACRDAVRRIGLATIEAPAGTAFDEKVHQLAEGTAPPQGGEVAGMVATGFAYQGQLLRRALVTLKPNAEVASEEKTERIVEG